MPEHALEIQSFLGIDNTSDAVSRSVQRKGGIYFSAMDNVDIDDNGKPHRRVGYGSAVVTGTKIRSLWANDDICLYAKGTIFYKLNTDNSSTELVTGVDPDDTFAYVEVGNFVYFSNSSIVGYIDTRVGTASSFSTPTETFKEKMVGGQVLEFYNSRLYAAHGSNLYFSDPTIPTRMDNRKNAIAFPTRIKMVKAVSDGIYVSDSDKIHFLSGRSPTEFVSRIVSDIPAVEGMSVSGMVKKRKMITKSVYWIGSNGCPYEGYSEGIVVAKQEGLFALSDLESGTAIIKSGTYQQLITIGRLEV